MSARKLSSRQSSGRRSGRNDAPDFAGILYPDFGDGLSPLLNFCAGNYNELKNNLDTLEELADKFIEFNHDPSTSPNFDREDADDLRPILGALSDRDVTLHEEVSRKLLTVLKILSRKYESRIEYGVRSIKVVTKYLEAPRNFVIAAEGANVVLNLCYEKENVEAAVRYGCITPLLRFLGAVDDDLKANAAGAIQSICYQTNGREFVREADGISRILELMASTNLKVQTRAVGAIHNLSSDCECVVLIRDSESGIEDLVKLLGSPHPSICASAAGALQNCSREVECRDVVKDAGAVPLLVNLLFGSDVQCQVCAAGALLNIVGPELGPEVKENEERARFKAMISQALTLSMVYHGIYSEEPPD
eukprot:Rmarinus@m.23705